MNYKNKLQEFLQKNKIQVHPIYNTRSANNTDQPPFYCELVINDKTYKSDYLPTKKEAEQDAARVACIYLIDERHFINYKSIDAPYIKPKFYKTLILLDLENINSRDWSFPDAAFIVGFASKYSSIFAHRSKYESKMKLKIIDSHVDDAADILLICYLTKKIIKYNVDNIIIVTRDHYGSVLKSIYPHINIRIIVSEDEL